MKEKDKKRKTKPSDFLKYRRKEMKGRERNAFERELQRDPFTGEALEGLESITPEQIRTDMRRMKTGLSERTGRRRIKTLYRIAASLLIILSVGSLIIITTRKPGNLDNTIAINNKLPEPTDTPKSDTLQVAYPDMAKKTEDAPDAVAPKNEKPVDQDEIITVPVAGKAEDEAMDEIKAGVDSAAELKAAEKAFVTENNKARAVAAPAAMVSEIRKPDDLIQGRIISSEDNMPLPGVTVQIKGTTIGTTTDVNGNFSFPAENAAGQQLVASYIGMKSKEFVAKNNDFAEIKLDPDAMALNEVVVVGYGVSRKKDATGAATRIEMEDKTPYIKYMPPEPETGREAYDKYIEESIRKPVEFNAGDRIVVVVAFMVTSNGTIDSLRVLRSGGDSYSEEAIRVIKEGPSWKPATENGKKIDDEVRIRIVFK